MTMAHGTPPRNEADQERCDRCGRYCDELERYTGVPNVGHGWGDMKRWRWVCERCQNASTLPHLELARSFSISEYCSKHALKNGRRVEMWWGLRDTWRVELAAREKMKPFPLP